MSDIKVGSSFGTVKYHDNGDGTYSPYTAIISGGSGGSGGGTSSNFGSAFPTSGTAIGASNGTNMVALVLGNTTMSTSLPVTLASNDTNTTPFITAAAGGYVRQDSTATIAKESGGNLATIATNTGNGATSANQTNGTQQSRINDGTNTANVKSIASGNNALVVGQGYMEQTGLSAGSLNADLIASVDVSNYSEVALQVAGTWSGTLTTQFSNDNTNFSSYSSTTGSGAGTGNTMTANGMYRITPMGRYMRVRMTAYTSGTATGVAEFYTISGKPTLSAQYSVSQVGTWNVGSSSATGSAIPANAFYIGASDGTNLQPLRVFINSDGFASSAVLSVTSQQYNGSTYDRTRGNVTGVVVAAGATASNAGVSTTTYNAAKAVIVVNISAFTSGSLTVTINGVTSSGYIYPILTSTALAATGSTPFRIFPSATPSANAVANDMVPRTLQVVTTVSGTLTYGIDYELGV